MFFSLISEKLAEYNLGEEIGQGGFGCVFSGTRKVDNLPVSNVHEQLTVVSLEYNRGSEDKERQSHFCPCLHDRSCFPGFYQDDRPNGKRQSRTRSLFVCVLSILYTGVHILRN